MSKEKNRDVQIDLLRILSMLMIICLHYFYMGGILERVTTADGFHYYLVWTIEAICYVSVNIYVLISGYYLSVKRFRVKRLLLIILETWFYSMAIYGICCACGLERFNWKSVVTAYMFPVIKGQWWFSTVYGSVSVILNVALNAMNRKQHIFSIALLFCLFSVIPDMFFFSIDQLGVNSGYSLLWFIMLYVTAAYLRKYGVPEILKRRGLIVFFLLTLFTAFLKFVQEWLLHTEYFNLYSYSSPTVFIASVALFAYVVERHIKYKGGIFHRIICGVSASTYAVFLIHTHICLRNILWDDIVKPLEHIGNWPYMVAAVAAIFVLCTVIDYIRRGLFYPLENSRFINRIASSVDKVVVNRGGGETIE